MWTKTVAETCYNDVCKEEQTVESINKSNTLCMDTTIQPFFAKNIFATCLDKKKKESWGTICYKAQRKSLVYNAIFK